MTTRRIVGLIALFVAAATAPTVTTGSTGGTRYASVMITTGADSAWLVLDSVRVGTTPFASDSVAPGRHIVRLVPFDILSWLTTPVVDTVDIAPGEHRQLRYTMPGGIALLTEPSGANVMVRDSLIGQTPLLLSSSGSPTPDSLNISKEGYSSMSLPFPSGGGLVCRIALKRAGTNCENPMIKDENINRSPARLLFWGGVTIAAGFADDYLKIRADGKSTAYQTTGDPDALAAMRRLDRGAGVSFALTEICFAYLPYFLLID